MFGACGQHHVTSTHETSRFQRISASLAALVALACVLAPLHAVDRPPDLPRRIVAIGDVHGAHDSLVGILQRTGVIDAQLKWAGGTATLVQTGDLIDRGAKVRQVLDLLMALEGQAATAGGHVVVLLGNHEVMNLLREPRDVSPQAYAAFADGESAARQDRAYREYVALTTDRRKPSNAAPAGPDKDAWLRAHPPGSIEYEDAFGPDGVYGRWLRSKSVVTAIGDTAFMHAGIDPDHAPRSLDAVNRSVRDEIRRFDDYRRYLIDRRIIVPSSTLEEIVAAVVAEAGRNPEALDARDREVFGALVGIEKWDCLRPDGPLWFRAFATWSNEEGIAHLRTLRDKYHVEHWVVGHSPVRTSEITPRYGSKVFLIDTGMVSGRVPGERTAALEIRDGKFIAISQQQQAVLPDR
jgi:hypothetical protein